MNMWIICDWLIGLNQSQIDFIIVLYITKHYTKVSNFFYNPVAIINTSHSLLMMSATFPSSNHRLLTPSTVPIYSFDWSPHSAHFCSLAVGTFVTQRPHQNSPHNQIQLAALSDPQVADFSSQASSIVVDFPITKVQYSPHRVSSGDVELLGVSGDGLRIYKSGLSGSSSSGEHELIAKLVPAQISTSPNSSNSASRRPSDANIITNNQNGTISNNQNISRNSPAPITSFDWNRVDSNLLVTSSYDTTCAVWNLDVN